MRKSRPREVSCPMLHSKAAADPGFELRSFVSGGLALGMQSVPLFRELVGKTCTVHTAVLSLPAGLLQKSS